MHIDHSFGKADNNAGIQEFYVGFLKSYCLTQNYRVKWIRMGG